MSIIQATRSVADIMDIDAYKLNTDLVGEDFVVHHPNPALGRDFRETWKVVRKIGQGGFGSVWLEEEQETGVLRAVKKIYLEKSRNFPYSRELNALIKVWNHRELFVQFLGWYEKPDFVFVTMEYLENGDLEKYLKSFRLKAKSEAKEIAIQLLEGLKVLHENKICHRDLKPNNILIAHYSPIQVKLADFGSSKSTINTSLRTSCGTSGYMAPELLKLLPSKKRYDNSLDIWSLGCVIHEILTSKLPFLRKSEDTDSSANSSSTIRDPEPACSTPEVDVDIRILMSFCAGEIHFPEDVLLIAGVSVVGINFLKRLLAANPSERISASEALQSRDKWFFEMREELYQEDSSYILKEQFRSLGMVLSSSAINSLISQCIMRRKFGMKFTDLATTSFSADVINEAIKRGYNLIIEILLPLLLPGVDVCIYVDAVVKCGNSKTMISVLRGASLVNTKKFCQMAFYLAAGLGYPAAIMLLLGWGQLNVNSKTEFDETALHLAAASGHDEVVALLLDRGAEVESKTEYGKTALHLAAESGHHEVFALLLDRGANMESKTGNGQTALHIAARFGRAEVVTLLLDRGAYMESKARDGETALHLAAESGNHEVVVLLLDRGLEAESNTKYGKTAFHLAAESGNHEVVALLLDRGAEVESKTKYGKTVLHSAAESGHYEVVALLLDRGADVDFETKDYRTALHLAAESGNHEVVALLLDRGADVESRTEIGETALHLAAESGHHEVVALLLDRGADVESRTEIGETALHLAAESGHHEVVALLLDRGANMESKTGNGQTALHIAARFGRAEVVTLLLDRGADMGSKARVGETALHLAAESGNHEVVALLLDRGADVESRTEIGETALHLAAESGHHEVVALLLDRGANMESKAEDGKTALHLAAEFEYPEVAALLLDRGADIESKTENGETAFLLATRYRHHEVALLLCNRRAGPPLLVSHVSPQRKRRRVG